MFLNFWPVTVTARVSRRRPEERFKGTPPQVCLLLVTFRTHRYFPVPICHHRHEGTRATRLEPHLQLGAITSGTRRSNCLLKVDSLHDGVKQHVSCLCDLIWKSFLVLARRTMISGQSYVYNSHNSGTYTMPRKNHKHDFPLVHTPQIATQGPCVGIGATGLQSTGTHTKKVFLYN